MMSTTNFDVVTIGNAIVDIIGRCDDAYLSKHGCAKGSMNLVDQARMAAIYAGMGPATEISGGSAANTAVGVASFGGRAAFVGKVADDEFGRIFAHDIKAANVAFHAKPVPGGSPTSRSLILVTPDGERTMNTLLGISTELDSTALDPTIIGSAKVVYLEGYLFDKPEAKRAFERASAMARSAGRHVALTLSDSFCVDRHRNEFLALIRSGIDIVFANEAEIKSLYETDSFDAAARKIQSDARLSVLTRSAKGSIVVDGEKTTVIDIEPVSKVVDTTGAGDLYAAGFLHGFTQGLDHARSGRLAAIAAAEIISHTGARPETSLSELARQKGAL